MVAEALSSEQAHALLDILSHHEVYAEIQDFRIPSALSTYGPPFQTETNAQSSSPSLQALLAKFALPLPGLRDVSPDFWRLRCAAIVQDLEKADLSESYDKGVIGIRKTLATAMSALIEYPVRGIFAGLKKPGPEVKDRQYNMSSPKDLHQAFSDCMHEAVYGNVIEELFKKVAETDKLSDHTPLAQATHEFGLVNIASFMHYALILSPKGQFLLTLIDHANKLVPYTIIKQTLKIGNVASMMSAMMKVVLAKMSVASVTNWIGWTNTADEGMNLLQQIVSTVLHWDMRDLKSKAVKIEKDKEAPTKDQLHALKSYVYKTREEHEAIREKSQKQSESVVFVILLSASTSTHLTSFQHSQALEYLAIQLSIRDREQIVQVLCHSQPDHLTQSVRDLAAAYEPIIRHVHNAVDLSETVTDVEHFLRDMIKLSKLPDGHQGTHRGRDGHGNAPTVGDFVQLLKNHQGASHKFLHQCAKNGKEVTSWFREYALEAVKNFRQDTASLPTDHTRHHHYSSVAPSPAAGSLTMPLNNLFTSLPEPERDSLAPILDAHALYLSKLHAASAARLRAVLTSSPSQHHALSTTPNSRAASRTASPAPSSPISSTKNHFSIGGSIHRKHKDHAGVGEGATNASTNLDINPGPGAYLAKWQSLLDGTAVTPDKPEGGEVRTGVKASVLRASRECGDDNRLHKQGSGLSVRRNEEEHDEVFEEAREGLDELGLKEDDKVPRPDVSPVVRAMGPAFRELLGRMGRSW